jgi:hypothetical protein
MARASRPLCDLWLAVRLGLLAVLAGCGEVATPGYPGEALAILRGVVANPDGLALPTGASAHLVWDDDAGGVGRSQVAASTTVETRLPANFSIALYTAPPAEVVQRPDGYDAARGHVVVVNEEQLGDLAAGRRVDGVHGRTDRFELVWLPDAEDAAAEAARLGLRTPLGPGFHLLSRADVDAAFTPVPLASIIPLELVDGSATQEAP